MTETMGNQDMVLGEMRGQLREVVHSMNAMSAKFDSLSREVIGLSTLAADVAAMKIRVTALETERNRRDGATGIIQAIVKSPAVGWMVGGATFVWALLTGRVHL